MKILYFCGKGTVPRIECSLSRFSRMIAIVGILVFSSLLSFSASLKTVVNGISITVSADDSVLPEGTTVSARLLTGAEHHFYLSGLAAERRVVLGQPMAFDITLHDANGAAIQPQGEVEVVFSGLDPGEKPEELVVFHAMAAKKAPVGTFSYEIRYPSHSSDGWLKSAAIPAREQSGTVKFTTTHFSVYLVGTTPTATYDFYVGTTKIGTQIILNNEYLLEPETPAKIDGKRFTGWYDGSAKVTFGAPIAVSETKTVKVDAKYEEFWYVYFDNNGTVATKEVTPGSTTDDTGIPLVITTPGMAFGHWSASAEPGGTAFDFSTPITQNTTLYAVLASRWKVSFDTHGGTTTLPIYIVSGSQMGPVPSPEKAGYNFLRWNTQPDGSGTNYTSTSVITSEVALHAIWGPQTNTPYTVVYWQENANDDGYTYVETVNKTGTTDQPATFDTKTYTGFSLNNTKTNAAAVNIGGSGTTIRNVYYQRNRWTLTFRLNSDNSVLKTYSGIKYGQDTSVEWYEASGENPTFLWSTTRNGNTYWSAPPTMPNADLTTWGRALGTTKYEIYYREDGTSTDIRPKFSFEGSSGMNITTEDLIELPGFTYKNYNNFNSENPKKAYVYYTRNNYVITFHKNDGSGSVNSSQIPYQASLAGKALTGFVEGVTTRDDGYIFGGWYTDPLAIENKFNFSGTMPYHNLILYGKWTPPVYEVRIHKVLEEPGPGGNSYTITLDFDGRVVESSLIKENPGGMSEADFLGWYWYVNDNVFIPFDFDLPVSVNTIELFPVWKIATFGVTYDLNDGGGTPPVDNFNYFLGSYAIVLPPTGVTAPDGQVFSGWSNNGSGVYYPNVRINITGNMTLKARWSDIPGKTSLTYFANNGTTNSYNIPDLEYNQTQTVLSPDASVLGYSLSGYTFAGWNSSDDGDGDWFNTGNQVIVGKVAPNHLYAQWAKISIVKSGVFNDTNLDGVAQAGETITYTFAVKNEGFIPLVNVSVSDNKATPAPTSVASLAAGATTTFTATYTLTAADITAGKVDNSATVTGYTPVLLIPVTATDSETVSLTVCSLEITCPATEVEVACPSEIPAAIAERVTTKAELEGFGFTVTDYCESLKLARSVGTIPVCEGDVPVTYTITDGMDNVRTCIVTYKVAMNAAPVLPANGSASVECVSEITIPVPPTGIVDQCGRTVEPYDAGYVDSPSNIVCEGTRVYSWRYTDCAGQTSTWTYTFNVKDVTDPELTVPTTGLALGCNPNSLPTEASVKEASSATDNCTALPVITVVAGQITGDCEKSQTFTVTASDACGNKTTKSVTYTWKEDSEAPVFANLPAGGDLGCNPATLPACDPKVTATDNCDGSVSVTCTPGEIVSNNCGRSQSFTYYAEDACGNNTSRSVTYTWTVDRVPPVLTVSGDADLGCNPTPAAIQAAKDAITATAFEGCGGQVSITYEEMSSAVPCMTGYKRVFTATDECGNVSEEQSVLISWKTDREAPLFSGCPTAPIDLGLNPAVLPVCADALALVTVSDNCSEEIIPTCSAGNIQVSGDQRTLIFTLTATDECDNTSTCEVTYTWTSMDCLPSFTSCPESPVELGCNPATLPDCSMAIAAAGTVVNSCGGTITPTCTPGEIVEDGCKQTQEFVLTAVASHGSATCRVVYTWTVDRVPPVLTVSDDVDLGCNPTAAAIQAAKDAITARADDGCGGQLSITYTEMSSAVPCMTGYKRVFTAIDECGNVSEEKSVSIFWRTDTEAPVFANLPTGGDLGCNPATLPACDPKVTATDNCDGDVTVTCTAGRITSPAAYRKSQSFTYYAEDACGNHNSATVTYTWSESAPAPEVSVTHPTCTVPVGSIYIIEPIMEGLTYSIGGEYQNSHEFTRLIPGTYTVTVMTTSGCVSGAATAVINAQPPTPPTPVISGNEGPVCPGSELTYSGPIRMAKYEWSAAGATIAGAANQRTVTVIPALGCGSEFSLTLEVTNEHGCKASSSIAVNIGAEEPLSLTTSGNYTVERLCLSQDDVNTVFGEWLNKAYYKGGCTPVLSHNGEGKAPDACGGSVVVTWTLTDECGETLTASSTFTIPAAPEVVLTVPASYYSGIGKTQAEVDADYATWKAGGSFTGGCGASLSNDAPENAPSAILGGVYTVTWTVESYCEEQVSKTSTFSVAAAPPVVLEVPEDYTGTECMTQDAVNTAYNNWLGSAAFEGGCNPLLSNDGAGKAPNACGGSVVVTWTVTSDCGPTVTGTATFTVPAAPAVTYNVPDDYSGTECMSPREIQAALSGWLAEFSVEGGCGAEIYAPAPEVLPDMCEGGTITIPWTVSSDCGETISGTATFTIPAAPAVVLNVPADFTCTTCKTQAEVTAAYKEWLLKAYFTGGCNAVMTNNAPDIAPELCEGVDVTVTWTVTGSCGEDVVRTSTFSVPGGPELVLADVHCVYLNDMGMWTLNSSDISQITAGTKGENLTFTFSQRTFECKDVYPPYTRVYVTATDSRGCQSTGSLNMQVLDTLPPVAICRDITVQLDANGQVLVVPGFVNDGGDRENVPEWYKFFKDLEGGSYDNCGVAEMYLSKSIFTRADVGPNQVILTVVDPSGNTGQCVATVTVVDPYAEPSTGPGDDTPGNGRANTAPTLADITDVMVMDEALQLEVNLSGISAGAETDQKVTVMAVSDNPALIPGIAVIYTEGSTGRLMLTVGAGVSGEAWITVTVKDDGGTANGGKDMIQKRFKVTVEAGGIGVTDPDGDDIVAGVTDPDEGDVVTGVIDVTSEMDFRLYPNPTRGKLTIEMTGAGIRDAEVTIYTLQGAMVFNKTFRAGEQIEIDMTPYTSGVYMVRTDVEGTTFMRKVILDK